MWDAIYFSRIRFTFLWQNGLPVQQLPFPERSLHRGLNSVHDPQVVNLPALTAVETKQCEVGGSDPNSKAYLLGGSFQLVTG